MDGNNSRKIDACQRDFGGKNCLEEKKESPISDRDGQLVAINISLINNVDKMYNRAQWLVAVNVGLQGS